MNARFAFVSGARTRKEVIAYLPLGYRLIGEGARDGRTFYVIGGFDDAGWTLDGYVIPRLASGLIGAREVSEQEARDIVASSSSPDSYIGLPAEGERI